MSLYNLLFGRNGQSDLLLAVIGLREVDVERFRDVFAGDAGATIRVYTRTGGGNREGYPNLAMRKLPEWQGSVDDDYDSTYCTDTFAVPEQWRADVAALSDPLEHGLRREFAQHLRATLKREATESDKEAAAHDAERFRLSQTKHIMANGHTFVPLDDGALKVALDLAEANGGKLRSCWGIAPIALTIKSDFVMFPNALDESERKRRIRAEIGYDFRWTMDAAYWRHMQERFGASHPLTMIQIAETVERYPLTA